MLTTKLKKIQKKIGVVLENLPSKIVRQLINSTHNCHFHPAEKLVKQLGWRYPVLSGYVPYFRNCTKIVLYNFFARNYGIRSSIDGVIVLSLRGAVVEIVSVIIKPDEIFEFDCPDIDADVVLLYITHSSIRYNHGNSFGHLRFFGVYGCTGAITHSMPTQGTFYIQKKNFIDKRRRPLTMCCNESTVISHVTINKCDHFDNSNVEEVLTRKLALGFWCRYNKNDVQSIGPSGVWHGGSFYDNVANNIFTTQIIPVPSVIDDCEIICSFDEFCIGAVDVNLIYCAFKGEKTIQVRKISITVLPDDILMLSDLCGGLNGINFVCVDCVSNSDRVRSYINFSYVTKLGPQDGMHAHVMNSPLVNKERQLIFKDSRGFSVTKKNALKFFYIPNFTINRRFEMHVFIRRDRVKFKVRVLSREGKEFVMVEEHNAGCVLIAFNSLPFDFIPAIVQLESFEENIDATFILFDMETCQLACDHLTGG